MNFKLELWKLASQSDGYDIFASESEIESEDSDGEYEINVQQTLKCAESAIKTALLNTRNTVIKRRSLANNVSEVENVSELKQRSSVKQKSVTNNLVTISGRQRKTMNLVAKKPSKTAIPPKQVVKTPPVPESAHVDGSTTKSHRPTWDKPSPSCSDEQS